MLFKLELHSYQRAQYKIGCIVRFCLLFSADFRIMLTLIFFCFMPNTWLQSGHGQNAIFFTSAVNTNLLVAVHRARNRPMEKGNGTKPGQYLICGMFRWWKLMSEFLKWKLKCSNKRLVSSEPPSSPLLQPPFKEPKYLPGQNANYTLNCGPLPHQDLLLTFRNICLDRQFRALVVMHGWNRTLSCQHSAICGERIKVFVVVSQKTTRLFVVCQVKQKRNFIWCRSLKKK